MGWIRRVGDDRVAGRDRIAGIIGLERHSRGKRRDRVGLLDVEIVDAQRDVADRLEDGAQRDAARLLRLQVGRGERGLAIARRPQILRAGGAEGRDRAAILRQIRIVEQAGRVGDVPRGRQRVRLAEAGDAETARPVAAQRQHLEGLDLRADLRREIALAGRIMVVAARRVELEELEHRHAQLAERRGDRAVPLGAERVDREVTLGRPVDVAVRRGRIDRFVEERAAHRELDRAARKLEQRLAHARLDLVEIRRRIGVERRCQIALYRSAVGRGIDEIVRAVGDHVEQVLDIDIAVGRTAQIRVHRRRIDLVVPVVAEAALDARGGAIHAAAALVIARDVGHAADQQRRLARSRERVVRVERAVGRGAVHARGADIDRKRQRARTRREARATAARRIGRIIDARRRIGVDRRRQPRILAARLLEVELQISLGRFAERLGDMCGEAEAIDLRRDHAVAVGHVLLAHRRGHQAAGRLLGRRGLDQRAIGATAPEQLVAAARARRDIEVRAGGGGPEIVAVDQVVRPADRGLVVRVERTAQVAGADRIGVIVEAADIGVEPVAIEVAGAGGDRETLGRRDAVLRDAGLGPGREAGEAALGDDVHHARDRIGAVARRSAVLQHFDAVDDVVRNGVEIDEVASRVVGERIIGRTQAIEQHQRRVGRQAAQRDARRAAGERAIGREAVGERGTVIRGKALQAVLDGADAALIKRFGRDGGHRRRRDSSREQRAGDDDLGVVGRRCGLALAGRGGGGGRRGGGGGVLREGGDDEKAGSQGQRRERGPRTERASEITREHDTLFLPAPRKCRAGCEPTHA